MKIEIPTPNGRRGWRCFGTTLLFLAITAITSPAQTFTTLLDFNGTDGAGPYGLVQGFDGNFYGTTGTGGANNLGTFFKATPAGALTTLYSFCSQLRPPICIDGQQPAAVVETANGDFYGTTSIGGGAQNQGTVFKITARGKLTTIYDFCPFFPCTDGNLPVATMLQAANGNLYGTTFLGGANNVGTIFEITPTGKFITLYSFCSQSNCADGEYTESGLIQASDGNLYGTTGGGGGSKNCNGGCGTFFKITPSGTLTTLHSFDHATVASTLVQGVDGNFYGATYSGGGITQCRTYGCGTFFKMTAAGTLTTLYSFCSQANCADGGSPRTPVLATDGNFYGTTSQGGITGSGTIFKITPQGVLTTLYNLCSQANCTDGWNASLVQGTDGNFYGTTVGGGSGGIYGPGTLFRLSTGLGPFVKLLRQEGKVGQSGGILGQGFIGTTGVFLNGTPASFTVVSDNYIQATVPAGATSGFITVSTPSGTLTSNVIFHVGQ
jgi:uncharacterized repeat protein (TIGR03803 family)